MLTTSKSRVLILNRKVCRLRHCKKHSKNDVAFRVNRENVSTFTQGHVRPIHPFKCFSYETNKTATVIKRCIRKFV